MVGSRLWFASAALAGFVASQSVNSTVGTITGGTCASTSASRYLGIPFAQPPTGSLRFKAPVAYNGTGTIDATTQKAVCYQFGYSPQLAGVPKAEDCLYLNVFVPPAATSSSGLPVKYWIHGGSFRSGGTADPAFDGCNLATDAIVVTVAYRLGPLGFMYLPDAGIAGNMAIQDLILGLEWVQSNIASFGGDPTKVVVFGESAGAIAAWTLAGLASAPKLMKSVIAESGAGIPAFNPPAAVNSSSALAQALGCATTDLTCISGKSPEDISKAIAVGSPLSIASVLGNGFAPVIDGKVIPRNPLITGSKVPAIAGTNLDEGTLFIAGLPNNGTDLTADNYTTILELFAGPSAANITAALPLSTYSTEPNPAFAALSHIITQIFRCVNGIALQNTANGSVPIYTYLFSHTPSAPWSASSKFTGLSDNETLAYLGPSHTAEIPFVWDTFSETSPSHSQFTQEEHDISDTLIAAWTAMAATGTPGNVTTWPAWSNVTSEGLLINDVISSGVINTTECKLWIPVIERQFVGIGAGARPPATNATTNGTLTSTASASGSGSSPTGGSTTATSVPGSDGVVVKVNSWVLCGLMAFFAVILL